MRKKVALSESIYTIDFNKENGVEISTSEDCNRHILTHIFISFVRVYENKWTGRNYSISYKLHKIANNLYEYFICNKKRAFVITSSDEDEKENSF